MPVLYHIAPDMHVIYYAGFGHCTGHELLAAEHTARHDPLREPNMSIIVDLQAVTELDIGLEDIRQGVNMNRQLVAQDFELEKTAIVTRKALDELVADTYADFAEPVVALKMATFDSLASALAWLALAAHQDAIKDIRQALHEQYREPAGS